MASTRGDDTLLYSCSGKPACCTWMWLAGSLLSPFRFWAALSKCSPWAFYQMDLWNETKGLRNSFRLVCRLSSLSVTCTAYWSTQFLCHFHLLPAAWIATHADSVSGRRLCARKCLSKNVDVTKMVIFCQIEVVLAICSHPLKYLPSLVQLCFCNCIAGCKMQYIQNCRRVVFGELCE